MCKKRQSAILLKSILFAVRHPPMHAFVRHIDEPGVIDSDIEVYRDVIVMSVVTVHHKGASLAKFRMH